MISLYIFTNANISHHKLVCLILLHDPSYLLVPTRCSFLSHSSFSHHKHMTCCNTENPYISNTSHLILHIRLPRNDCTHHLLPIIPASQTLLHRIFGSSVLILTFKPHQEQFYCTMKHMTMTHLPFRYLSTLVCITFLHCNIHNYTWYPYYTIHFNSEKQISLQGDTEHILQVVR